jgi:hypothetical protein
MTTASTIDVARLRSQLTTCSRHAETAFERAFDLQQAGASSERIDAALAEVTRLQEAVRQLRAQLPEAATLH